MRDDDPTLDNESVHPRVRHAFGAEAREAARERAREQREAKRIDLHEPIEVICQRLHLDPKDVAEIRITPSRAEVLVYLNNEQGKKHVDPATGLAVMARPGWDIRT